METKSVLKDAVGERWFRIDDRLDLQALATSYRSKRRLHIPQFLNFGAAARLYQHLLDSSSWSVRLSADGVLQHSTAEELRSLDTLQSRELYDLVYSSAQRCFSFLQKVSCASDCDTIHGGLSPLAQFEEFA